MALENGTFGHLTSLSFGEGVALNYIRVVGLRAFRTLLAKKLFHRGRAAGLRLARRPPSPQNGHAHIDQGPHARAKEKPALVRKNLVAIYSDLQQSCFKIPWCCENAHPPHNSL